MAQNSETASNVPSRPDRGPRLIANIVVPYKDGNNEEQEKWVEVGAAFPHDNGKGYNVVLHPGLAVSGKIVLTLPLPPRSEQ
jgi:hypothetical protein